MVLTGKEAHHVIPQAIGKKFKKTFEKLDININDPRFGARVEKATHQKWSKAYQGEWKKYFKELEIAVFPQNKISLKELSH